MEFQHKSVLLQECIDALNIRPDGIYLDGTLGGAGHSSQIARRLTEGGRLIGVDRDRTALAAAKERLAPYADRVTLVHSNFAEIDAILDSLGIPAVDGMLFDLGVSSPQLDDASRGFSYYLTCGGQYLTVDSAEKLTFENEPKSGSSMSSKWKIADAGKDYDGFSIASAEVKYNNYEIFLEFYTSFKAWTYNPNKNDWSIYVFRFSDSASIVSQKRRMRLRACAAAPPASSWKISCRAPGSRTVCTGSPARSIAAPSCLTPLPIAPTGSSAPDSSRIGQRFQPASARFPPVRRMALSSSRNSAAEISGRHSGSAQ